MRLLPILVGLMLASVAVASLASAATVQVRVGSADETHAVEYLRYYPETAVVWAGDAVTWKAAIDVPHTVTQFPPGPGGFDSSPQLSPDKPELAAWFGPGGFLMPAQEFAHTFDEAGEFEYHCLIHETMTGKVRVVEEAGPGVVSGVVQAKAGWGSGDTTVNLFSPAELVVTAGTTVVWTNLHTAEPHTVTAMVPGMDQEDAHDGDTGTGMEGEMAEPAFNSSPNVGPLPEWFFAPGGVLLLNGPFNEFSHTFDTPGTYEYFCKLHPAMWGTVVVLERPKAPAEAGGGVVPAGTVDSRDTPAAGLLLVLAALAFVAVAVALRRR